jgi:hypothetical protein
MIAETDLNSLDHRQAFDQSSNWLAIPGLESYYEGREPQTVDFRRRDHSGGAMSRIIIANRRGHQVVEWEVADTEEARALVQQAEQIIREARQQGCAVSKKVDGRHVIDESPFDPHAEEYQIIAPIAGG